MVSVIQFCILNRSCHLQIQHGQLLTLSLFPEEIQSACSHYSFQPTNNAGESVVLEVESNRSIYNQIRRVLYQRCAHPPVRTITMYCHHMEYLWRRQLRRWVLLSSTGVITATFNTMPSHIITLREHYGQKHQKGRTKITALELSKCKNKDILASP